MKKLHLIILLVITLCSCNAPKDNNYLGNVEKLPAGKYTIKNWGSRHIVRCERPDGKYYTLNDSDFDINNIDGYDAHQYHEPTRIVIK